MVDGLQSWWRFIALTLIVLVLTLSASLALTALWTDLLRAKVTSQQETLGRLDLLVDSLRREVEAFGRTDLSRGIDISQTKSRLERVERILYDQARREQTISEGEDH